MANQGAIMQGSVYTTVFPTPVGMTTITSLPDKIFEIAFYCPGLKLVWPKTVCKTSSGLLDPTAVFSPDRGLAGFPQEKLKWRIKTKKMRPLERRGKLRVKRT